MNVIRGAILVAFSLGIAGCASGPSPSREADRPLPQVVMQSESARAMSEATGTRAIVSTQGRASTQAARQVLAAGGNVIDAAVAASFVISVERPQSTGIAGGGFLLYREAKTGKIYAIDFRERAPAKARPDMFLDAKGEPVAERSLDGILSVAVPGMVAGMAEIHARWGSRPWKTLLKPAIELARGGFEVYPYLAESLEERRELLASFPASRKIFLHLDGSPYRVGERLVQNDLARTLETIAREGRRGFYQGRIARAIEAESRRLGGILTREDLAHYTVKWRDPVRGTFRGHEIVSMPPPSSGGTHVIEMLNLLESEKLEHLGAGSADAIHLESSAMQLAFADRARFMGDPDFVKVPTAELVSKSYAERQRARIDRRRHVPSDEISAGKPGPGESPSTTHFSIMDAEGNVVSSTQTINYLMGSGVVVPGTGIVLNDEMDDFSAKPGASNVFGAVGSDANSVQPGKTPLSSMSPTIVLRDGQPILAVGSPGGTRIINCVFEMILNRLVYGMSLYDSINTLRFHHQWKPDVLRFEPPGPGAPMLKKLAGLGYATAVSDDEIRCRIMAVERETTGLLRGVSDPRDAGAAEGI